MEQHSNQAYILEHHVKLNETDSLKIIGVFSSFAKAKDTQHYYQNHVQGFCETPNGFTIRCLDKTLNMKFKRVYLIVSWKQYGDEEKDIRYENLFSFQKEAVFAIIRYRFLHLCRKCMIEAYTLNQPEWREGFIIE